MTDEAQNEMKELSRNQIIAWWGSIVGVCLVIAFGSIFVTRAYLERRNYEIANYRPPHVATARLRCVQMALQWLGIPN